MLGYYELFDSNSSLLGKREFGFTVDDGFFDLGQQITGSLASYHFPLPCGCLVPDWWG